MAATTDGVLLEALRQRMKRQLEKEDDKAMSNIINNYAGGGSNSAPSGSGVMSQLGGVSDDDAYDYYVNIDKNDKRDKKTGKTIGWTKKVTRSRLEKGETPEKKKGVKTEK